ncbi:hypothetical protein E4U41_002494 [Claviceps citrina]|nr:hypothetical protein E4U41_002494 [Claviceps citrina]
MDPDEAELRTESSDDCGADPIETQFNTMTEYASSQAEENDQPSGSVSPRKRPAQGASAFRPFKRQKGVFNAEYLELLNRDIDDAAQRVCLDEEVQFSNSQIGLTKWSAMEKRLFFEAISRLGRYDLPGIAARIGTKSEIEVQQYIFLLRDSIERRKAKNSRSYLQIAQYPAAVELSQQCCHAQEEVADAISVRQERREERREEQRWGPNWDITPSLARRLSRDVENGAAVPDHVLKFARLFHLPTWLRLSERAFMNSAIPANNWKSVDDKPPSMWATAFDDFYSLAVSITRRLVQSTLFISLSRIRAKRERYPARNVVRKKDVEAAIASLGMLHDSHELWRTSARRLRLDVFDEPPDKDDDDDDDDGDAVAEEEPMTYDEVEKLLSLELETGEEQSAGEEGRKLLMLSDDEAESAENAEEAHGAGVAAVVPESGTQQDVPGGEEYEIERDRREVLWYSAAAIRDVPSAKDALLLRIKTERFQEAQAERHDDYASHHAEADMWAILQRKPPMELPRVQDPGRVQMSNLGLDWIYPLGKNWATNLDYYEDWETLDAVHKEEEEERDEF